MDVIGLRLTGTDVPTGEITLSALSDLAGALHVLALRLARHLTERDGAGRTPAAVERAAELRLRGLSEGSTVLEMSVGEDGVLGDGLEHRTVDALFEVFEAITRDTPPDWITPGIGEATVSVLDALGRAGSGCDLTGDRHTHVRIAPRSAMRTPWTVGRVPDRRAGVSVSGRLEMLDLGQARLRIRDAVGHNIVLRSVADTAGVTDLIGELVTATGEAVLGARGQIVSLEGAQVTALLVPDWTAPALDLSRQPLVGAFDDLDDGVTDDDIDALLAEVRG